MIRAGSERDVASVCALEARIFPDPWRCADILAHTGAEHLSFFVWEEENRVIGYLLGSRIPPEGEIFRVAVAPEARRRGVAEALCRAQLSLCDTCYLEVRFTNASARALYEKLGFSLVGTRRNYYKNPVEDACLYRR